MRPLLALAAVLCIGCPPADDARPRTSDRATETSAGPTAPSDAPTPPVPPAPPAPRAPIELFEAGASRTVERSEVAGLVEVDLGDAWTPNLFVESDGPGAPVMPHPYRSTYLALARGEFPDDHHGERAREDRYLELYGIPPTLTVLARRFADMKGRACVDALDTSRIEAFEGFLGYEDNARAQAEARRFAAAERIVTRLRAEQADAAVPDVSTLSRVDQDQVRAYLRAERRFLVVADVQARLACEGYFEGKGRYVRGALDWATHEAIAEFERRHRMLGWGNVARDTLAALKKHPLELEREAVVRVLTERAMIDAGFLEDGSITAADAGGPNRFLGADGREHDVPNLEAAVRTAVVRGFGLDTVESTGRFLASLGTLPPTRVVGVAGVPRPEYHTPDMELSVEIDRGDVWYEFPYDEQGAERPQGVERRPRLTVFTTYQGRRIALARFGTTIGGWRTESVNGVVMWAYKESPPGPVVWEKIVSAPVWLPPESAPPRSLLTRGRNGWVPHRHETGPSYASAYGLVAAYHRPYVRRPDGTIEVRGDQGIRAHGSVDYMSIARRHSHGCHRLHNHMAVRLMSFVLHHRAHERRGEDDVAYTRNIEYEGKRYTLNVTQGGYEFALIRPIPVEVLPGRILGDRETPITTPLPRFDSTLGVYLLPDGGAATVDRLGTVTPVPFPDAGIADAAVDAAHDASVRDAASRDAVLDAGVPVP